MKGCDYCRKVNNIPLLDTEGQFSGMKVWIEYRKAWKEGLLKADGFYDSFVGLGCHGKYINYCPMCGREFSR